MVQFPAGRHRDILANFELVATRSTGELVHQAQDLDVRLMPQRPQGPGTQPIGAQVAAARFRPSSFCVIR
jgi:methylglyoxal synthase